MKKNENMNPDSVKSLKEFREKQIKTNKKLHIIFLSMITIINICLINFIIMYKKKISQIKFISSIRSTTISKDQKAITFQQNSLYHKLINIFAVSYNVYGNTHFSMLFEKSEEVNMVKNHIAEFSQIDNPILRFIYQGGSDTDNSKILLDSISYLEKSLFVFGTNDDNNKFGFFFEKLIYPNNEGYFESETDRCFIFSFQNKEKYPCLNNKKTFEINKNNLLNIGDGDIIINHDFLIEGGIINFPFKSFDIEENKENVFKKLNGKFEIRDIEIYVIN